MPWVTTMTKAGLAALAASDGKSIKVTSAWTSSGVVPEEDLSERPALVLKRQKLSIIEDASAGNKRDLRLQLTNGELDTGYTNNQLGIFVSVDGSGEILYFVAQNMEGDIIPAKTTLPGFVAEYIVSLYFLETSDASVNTDMSAFVTYDGLDSRLERFGGGAGIAISPTEPENQPEGGIWYDTSGPQPTPGGEGGVMVMNAVVSDSEPEDRTVLWFHTDPEG